MTYGFTTLRDLGSADPDWPTVDLRTALDAGFVDGPRLVVAAHIFVVRIDAASSRPWAAQRIDRGRRDRHDDECNDGAPADRAGGDDVCRRARRGGT